VAVSTSHTGTTPKNWPSARYFTEAIQCPSICFSHPLLRSTLPAVDRLGMPLVTSGQFAYVYKLKSVNGGGDFAVRCFRGYLGDRDQRYRAIQDHLHSSPVSYLSDFSYAPEGILVGGNRFPILFMQWIEGPTLDLYLGEMLHRPDVLQHLCQEWLRLLSSLRASGVAHGDLQHGNIIVEHGQLRLVDHDGIYVPKMAGWTASEVGHQHYQHPHRTAQQFDDKLDNFSSLVIYLSLLSLAEQPGLWQEHHDENLLFTKNDFADPASSPLFKKIKELGPEHARLAEVLEKAAIGSPDEAPSVLDLVQQSKSNLPSWMTAPADLDTTPKTREVVSTERPEDRRAVRWIPWQEKQRGPSMPSTPGSPHLQSVFSAAPPGPAPLTTNPHDVWGNTIVYSKEFVRKYFLVWYWGAYILLKFLGFDFFLSVFAGLLCLALGCLTFGLVKAIDESFKAQRSGLAPRWQPPTLAAPNPPPALATSWTPPPNHQPPPSATTPTVSDPFVGNLVLGIYHSETCDWVNRISVKNRVGFSTASDAISHGFKPCRICSP
jgi:serine/threonine protein kinase